MIRNYSGYPNIKSYKDMLGPVFDCILYRCRKDSVEEVLAFLKSLPFRNTEAVKCGSKYLDEKIICAIGEAVEEAKVSLCRKKGKVRGI